MKAIALLKVVLAAALLASAGAASDARQDKKPGELQKAQTQLEASAVQAALAIAKVVKEERVAVVDLRPAVENAAASANAPVLQNFVMQVFLKQGLLVFPVEPERKLDPKYSK